ncbi:MAG: oligosaccharide flippase family protein [Ignavibacteriae bacterium]|nr:oligosaccharide flippase family protein [Ignavibacteriota bacterium]
MKKKLFHNIFYLFVIQGVNYILPLVVLPFLFINLEKEIYGIIAFSYTYMLFINIVVDYGFNFSSTAEISLNRENKKKINEIVSNTFSSKFILLILCFLVTVIFSQFIEITQNHKLTFLSMFGIVIGNLFFPIWFFQGIEEMKYMTITFSLAKILSFIPMFIFVRSPNDGLITALFYAFGYIFAGSLSFYIMIKKFKVKYYIPSISEIIRHLKGSSLFFLSRIAASFYSIGNSIILGMVYGANMVAFYDVASKIVFAFSSLLSPIEQAIYPFMTNSKDIVFFKKIFKLLSLFGIVITFFLFYFGQDIILIIFKTSEEIIITTFRIMIFSLLISIPSQLLGYPFLAALGFSKYTNMGVINVGIIYIISIFFMYFFDYINIYSLSYIYVLAQLIVLINRIYGVKKFNLFRF